MIENKNCAIIVSSCDAYADAWDPFFVLFFRYWPDCPFRIILISNGREYKDPRVTTYKFANDLGWSGNLIEVLKNLSENFIIYFQEDYFLKKRVDNEKIFAALNAATETKAAYLQLYSCPGPFLPLGGNEEIGIIGRDTPYRNSTQTAIWDRQVLLSLLKYGETGWEFETKGGWERSRLIDRPFLSYQRPVVDYLCTAIVKGRYSREAIELGKKEGIEISTKNIKLQSWRQVFKYKMKKWLSTSPKI